jgi:hypothetical protein
MNDIRKPSAAAWALLLLAPAASSQILPVKLPAPAISPLPLALPGPQIPLFPWPTEVEQPRPLAISVQKLAAGRSTVRLAASAPLFPVAPSKKKSGEKVLPPLIEKVRKGFGWGPAVSFQSLGRIFDGMSFEAAHEPAAVDVQKIEEAARREKSRRQEDSTEEHWNTLPEQDLEREIGL